MSKRLEEIESLKKVDSDVSSVGLQSTSRTKKISKRSSSRSINVDQLDLVVVLDKPQFDGNADPEHKLYDSISSLSQAVRRLSRSASDSSVLTETGSNKTRLHPKSSEQSDEPPRKKNKRGTSSARSTSQSMSSVVTETDDTFVPRRSGRIRRPASIKSSLPGISEEIALKTGGEKKRGRKRGRRPK